MFAARGRSLLYDGFTKIYSQTTCPECRADLTQPRSVDVYCVMAGQGDDQRTAQGSLFVDGVLVDGNVAKGLHSRSLCARCQHDLIELEET